MPSQAIASPYSIHPANKYSNMKSFVATALSVFVCIHTQSQGVWGYGDLFLENETSIIPEESSTPSPSPISSTQTTNQSIMPTDVSTEVSTIKGTEISTIKDICVEDLSTDGVRMLRGSSISQEEMEAIMTAAYHGRHLQAAHPCVVNGSRIGDRCLVITNIKIIMTVWYRNIAGPKKTLGR